MVHGGELVEDLLLTVTETSVSLSFSLNVLKLDGDIQASIVEVRSRFEIVVSLVHDRHSLVSSETVTSRLISVVELSLLECVTDVDELLRRLVQSLLDLFVQFLFLDELVAWLDEGRSGLVCQVEKVDVSFHEAFRQQPNAHGHLILLLLQLETPILFNSVHCTACVMRLFLHFLTGGAVLLEHLRLSCGNELILLLGLSLPDNLTDASVRVHDWLKVFHIGLRLPLNC